MARKRTAAKAITNRKTEPELVFEDGYYWIVTGKKRENAGRSERYAQSMLAERTK